MLKCRRVFALTSVDVLAVQYDSLHGLTFNIYSTYLYLPLNLIMCVRAAVMETPLTEWRKVQQGWKWKKKLDFTNCFFLWTHSPLWKKRVRQSPPYRFASRANRLIHCEDFTWAHSLHVSVAVWSPPLYTCLTYFADPEPITKRWDVGAQCLSYGCVHRLWAVTGIKPVDFLSWDWATLPPFPFSLLSLWAPFVPIWTHFHLVFTACHCLHSVFRCPFSTVP